MANIVGGVTSINNPRTNWNQNDAKKADFLKNKPSVANSLKGHKTGAVISADDVSPIEHELDIKVTDADGVPMGGVIVKRYGKNLFNNDLNLAFVTPGGEGTTERYGYELSLPAGTYTVHCRYKQGQAYNHYIWGRVIRNGEPIGKTLQFTSGTGVFNDITETLIDGDILVIYDATSPIQINPLETAKTKFSQCNIQVELGSTATEFEPYIEPVEATADADGNVTGLVSLSPNMTLTTDNGGDVIECEYNRDANKVITDLETKLNTLISTIGG